ncbi:hypothetical protein GCM10025867_46450 (plasmid) [Frondihabitans sucicola]|uniref:Uncharacterized protein n=1 Tax=Frondihabitans sucicola TaxID=1268041 RepID=A0ABN6Y5R5_9MICO|nr:hypothetical protein [Frondihabitans sucicola]BDZ52404.1 hypothetical protein GCM10025867_46450 [Frondihabitans sucicola]
MSILDSEIEPELIVPSNPFGYGTMKPRFESEVKAHQMTILKDDGLYRHLSFRNPDNGGYWFDILTWPGSLVIAADMGSFTFRREPDMFEWFGTGSFIEYPYLSQKVVAVDARMGLREYDMTIFASRVLDYVVEHTQEMPQGDRQSVIDDVLARVILTEDYATQCEEGAREAILDYPGLNGFQFERDVDWKFDDFSAAFTWCCHAIRHGILAYRDAKTAPAAGSVES